MQNKEIHFETFKNQITNSTISNRFYMQHSATDTRSDSCRREIQSQQLAECL